MKILVSEGQYNRLLLEGTDSIDSFIEELRKKFKMLSEEDVVEIKKDIMLSGCNSIGFKRFNVSAVGGASLPDGVVINVDVIKEGLGKVIFVIFHEIAHQYQYKKYGKDFSYKVYRNDIDIDEAIMILKNTESVADKFGLKKYRKYLNMGLYPPTKEPMGGGYDKFTKSQYKMYIDYIKSIIKNSGITSEEEISTVLYNWLVRAGDK